MTNADVPIQKQHIPGVTDANGEAAPEAVPVPDDEVKAMPDPSPIEDVAPESTVIDLTYCIAVASANGLSFGVKASPDGLMLILDDDNCRRLICNPQQFRNYLVMSAEEANSPHASLLRTTMREDEHRGSMDPKWGDRQSADIHGAGGMVSVRMGDTTLLLAIEDVKILVDVLDRVTSDYSGQSFAAFMQSRQRPAA